MNRSNDEIEPIVLELTLVATSAEAYRAITSQTELRKWWAPRVILSRNIISQEEGRDVEMKLQQSEKNHMCRYSWKPLDWENRRPTVITIEINDLGVTKGKAGTGIRIDIIHDGWLTEEEKVRQEKIWNLALAELKHLLEGKPVQPWWENRIRESDDRLIEFAAVKQFVEKIEKDNKGKPEKKLASQNFLKICQALDGQGEWILKENGGELELRHAGTKIFGMMKNGNITLAWRELEAILGNDLSDFSNRLGEEQDLSLHIGKSQEKIPGNNVIPSDWSVWCQDVIRYARENA